MVMHTAAQIVARMARKYDVRPVWLWEVLDVHFNMRKGEGCVMDPAEVEAFKDLIEELLDT